MAPCVQLTAWNNCVPITLDKKDFSTGKIVKKFCCHHSTISRLAKLKRETDDNERKEWIRSKKATTIAEDSYLKEL